MQGMHLKFGIAEPVPEIGNLGLIAIIQMLAGAEDLHQRNVRVPDPLQPHGGQAVIREEVRRKGALHLNLGIRLRGVYD